MGIAPDHTIPGSLPSGYVSVPITMPEVAGLLSLCILVKEQPDPAGGSLVVLRDLLDARVFLGCVCDVGGRVQRWVEVWVQQIQTLAEAPQACREAVSNARMDARWQENWRALAEIDSTSVIQTGWETDNPLAIWIDLNTFQPISGIGEFLELCRDDALLTSAGHEPYSTSLKRYLFSFADKVNPRFIPVLEPDTHPDIFDRPRVAPFNPGGGLLLVKSFSPVRLEPFFDFLSGGTWEGFAHGKTSLELSEIDRTMKRQNLRSADEGWLFLGTHGRWGRLLEAFHLKLRLLADAVDAVRDLTQRTQRPLLNLSPDSFHVRMGEFGAALPFLWTARASLVDPGDALALPIEDSKSQYFLRARAESSSIYQPGAVAPPIAGRCSVRIRQVMKESGGTVIEGTFTTHERLHVTINDLLQLQLGIGSAPLTLYAHIETTTALAGGEWRFRTVPREMPARLIEQFKAAAGVPRSNCFFQVIPSLSTPCDLYSLVVIAARALLVNPQTTLPIALDELLSLARQANAEMGAPSAANAVPGKSSDVELAGQIRIIFGRDARWAPSLGPHRLLAEDIEPAAAFDLIPAELWWDMLASLVRAIPGMGKQSVCADFGDSPLGAMHRVFDRLADDLRSLLIRTRSLIVIDWRFNREIHSVIRDQINGAMSAGLSSAKEPAALAPAGRQNTGAALAS